MAYPSSYFPVGYQPIYPVQNQIQQPQPQQNSSPIIWVQGEGAARSYAVAPGQSVMLMDSESSTFFIKSADVSGMPLPLRIFDYTERTTQPQTAIPQIQQPQNADFITREEFEQRLAELMPKKQQPQAVRKEKVES